MITLAFSISQISNAPDPKLLENVPAVLSSLGMRPVTEAPLPARLGSWYVVLLDGRVIGHIMEQLAESLCRKLRLLKVAGELVSPFARYFFGMVFDIRWLKCCFFFLRLLKIPNTLEIVLLPRSDGDLIKQFSGIYLFSGNARMMRPVLNLAAGQVELIGSFEQVYLDVSISPEETIADVS